MDAVKIAAVGLVAGTLSILLRKTNPELAMQIGVGTGIVLIIMMMGYLREAVDFIRDFASRYSGVYDGVALVLKIIAISYICEFAVQVLKDGGENAIAVKVETGGKILVAVMLLPMLKNFIDLVVSLL